MNRPLNTLLAEMALELAELDTNEDTVETVAQYARIAVNGDDAGVMLVHGRDKVETPAGTSKDVDSAHQLQSELGEGPCLAAVEGGDEVYIVANTLGDERWPRWGRAASELGYFSVVSASLETESRRIGSLNVYSRSMDAFDERDAEVVAILSSHASAAIAAAKMQHELEKALDSRTLIGQAQGVLMRAFDIDAPKAFAYMRRLSQDENIKLVRVAERIVENRRDLGRPSKDA
jgi:transcriptional regulator with GAF, ATPase, and Fis domain